MKYVVPFRVILSIPTPLVILLKSQSISCSEKFSGSAEAILTAPTLRLVGPTLPCWQD